MTTRPDILLAHSYHLCEDAAEQRIMKPYPPLGVLYLSAYLKRRGFGVEVFDGTFTTPTAFEATIDALKPRAVGISCNMATRFNALRMIRQAKDRGIVTLLGGPEPVNYPHEYIESGADCVVHGEGEVTLTQLLERIRGHHGNRFDGIAGITFADESGKAVTGPARSPIGDLSALPWPDRDAIDIGRYLSTWKAHHGYGPVSLICARGCPYRCTWCSHSVFGRTHRRRSAQDVADEVEHIRSVHDPDALWFADDVFNIDHKWLHQFRDAMVRRNLTLPFECICRADRVDERSIEALVDLQCRRVWIGAESGSQRMLDAMQRGVRVEQVHRAGRLASAAGLEVGTFIMLGYDGETLEDIEATIDHLHKMAPDIVLTTTAYPIRGTEYHDAVSNRIVAAGSWSGRTDRNLRVRARHSPAFYASAQRWVNAEVQLDRVRRRAAPNRFAIERAGIIARWHRHQTRRRAPRNTTTQQPSRPRSHSPFDAVADTYDERFVATALGRWLRQRVWKHLAANISPGAAVLDIAGGTGEDACWLARQGAHVTYVDHSPRMLSIAAGKVSTRGVADRVTLNLVDLNDLSRLVSPPRPFDAVVANFGGINCVRDRRALASWLARQTRSGAYVALTVMGRFCPWEMATLALTNPARCLRRWRRDGVPYAPDGGEPVQVFYPSPARLGAEFRPWFERTQLTSLGVVLPPTAGQSLVERRPRLLTALAWIERLIARHWPATWLGDHYILEMRRV